MAEDRSLDDFAPDPDGESDGLDGDSDGTGESDGTSDSEPNAAPDTSDADPATATSTWHADGAACDRCGERVERRWRDGEAFVCADCASW